MRTVSGWELSYAYGRRDDFDPPVNGLPDDRGRARAPDKEPSWPKLDNPLPLARYG